MARSPSGSGTRRRRVAQGRVRRSATALTRVALLGTLATAALISGGVSAAQGPSTTTPTASTASTGAPAPNWNWVDRGVGLLSVSCPTAKRCVAVGGSGAVLSTSNGGATLQWSGVPWSSSQTDTLDALESVSCISSTCTAVSGSVNALAVSHAYRSTNGGGQWSDLGALPPRASGQTQLGDAVGCDPLGNCVIGGRRGGLWRALAGSSTWAPIGPASNPHPYLMVVCPAANTCLAAPTARTAGAWTGSRIVGTTVTDFTLATKGSVTALGCASSTRCLATDSLGNVFASTDGGATWSSVATALKVLSLNPPVSLSCPNVTTCTGVTATGAAVQTRDGGATWAVYPTGAPGKSASRAISCIAASCTAVGSSALYQLSVDSGTQWDLINAVPAMGHLACQTVTAGGPGVCLSGGKDDIGKSISGGALWRVPLGGVMGLDMASVSCLDPPNCTAIGKSLVLVSATDGETWRESTSAGSIASGPETAQCVTADYCVAGGSGTVSTTLDDTKTWWLTSLPGGPMLSGISCPTDTLCLASAKSGFVYRGIRTVDSAHPAEVIWHWRAYGTGSTTPLNGISCPTTTICVVVGFDGLTASSSNGGVTWTEHDTNAKDAWSTVTCPATTLCVAGGNFNSNTSMLFGFSTDGGQTWTRQLLGRTGSIDTVTCVSTESCVAGATASPSTLGLGGPTVLLGSPATTP